MRKFKLIKEYPGSVALGNEVANVGNNKNEYYYRGHWSVAYPNEFPEFWEEVIEKNYEILSFISISTNSIGKPSTKLPNGKHIWKDDEIYNETPESQYLNNTDYTIYSVKRLSDGKIFTIGDRVTHSEWDNNIGEISYMKINPNNSSAIYVSQKNNYWGQNLEKLTHSKKSLFITEDGIEIFEGDKYCYFRFHSWTCDMATANEKFYSQDKSSKNSLYFSTQEHAEKFILMNKPCLSINEVMTMGYGICSAKPMINYVKERDDT